MIGFKNKMKKKNHDLAMIPMINIIFLLLLFFMIAGNINNLVSKETIPPISQNQEPLETTEQHVIIKNNDLFEYKNKSINLTMLIKELNPKLALIIEVDANKRLSALKPLLLAAQQAKIESIRLITEEQ